MIAAEKMWEPCELNFLTFLHSVIIFAENWQLQKFGETVFAEN